MAERHNSSGPVFRPRQMMRDFRSKTMPRERTTLAIWFWEIDRLLLALIFILIAIGLVAVAAASPVAAIDRSTSAVSVDPLIYFYRQLLWVALGVPLMLGISMMGKERARRVAIGLALFFAFTLVLVPLLGSSVNGAKRRFAGHPVHRISHGDHRVAVDAPAGFRPDGDILRLLGRAADTGGRAGAHDRGAGGGCRRSVCRGVSVL